MIKLIRQRLFQLIPILIGITVVSFLMMKLTSADAIDRMYQMTESVVSESVKASQRKELYLDQPLVTQYIRWMKELLTGNLGFSFVSKRPVVEIFLEKLPSTMNLCLFSLGVTLLVSIPIGIFSALNANRLPDYVVRILALFGNAMPNFFVAIILIYIFGLKLGWFPIINVSRVNQSVILPGLTLAISMSSKYVKQIRIFTLDELNKEYVVGALARGVPMKQVLRSSVLKSVAFSLLSLVSISFGSLLGGTAVVETVFMLDGVGKMAIDAIRMSDMPIIQAYVIWMTLIFVGVHLLVDILYYYLDPRVRLQGVKG